MNMKNAKQTKAIFTGFALLLLGLLITGFNYFAISNPLYGSVGIFCLVAGVAIALIGSIHRKTEAVS